MDRPRPGPSCVLVSRSGEDVSQDLGDPFPPPFPRIESSPSHPAWRHPHLTDNCQLGPRAKGKIIAQQRTATLKTDTLDLPSPSRSLERPRICLTYDCEPGAFSKENFSVHTVTWGKEANKFEAWKEEGALAGMRRTLV